MERISNRKEIRGVEEEMGERYVRESMPAYSGGLKRNLLDSLAGNDIEERKLEEKLRENGERVVQ